MTDKTKEDGHIARAVEMVGVTLDMRPRGDTSGIARILDDFRLSIHYPCVVGVYGPNGAGKTTLLRLLAGLLRPDCGSVMISGKPPDQVRISMMYQNYRDTMLPWYSAAKNLRIASSSEGRKMDERRLREAQVRILGANYPLERSPATLSGGQQQRLCLARTLDPAAELLLFDEPFSALDLDAKARCVAEVPSFVRAVGATAIVVTHDLRDAITLADRLLVVTGHPLRIVDDISIDIGRPRSYQMYQDRDAPCWDIEARVYRSLYGELARR